MVLCFNYLTIFLELIVVSNTLQKYVKPQFFSYANLQVRISPT